MRSFQSYTAFQEGAFLNSFADDIVGLRGTFVFISVKFAKGVADGDFARFTVGLEPHLDVVFPLLHYLKYNEFESKRVTYLKTL